MERVLNFLAPATHIIRAEVYQPKKSNSTKMVINPVHEQLFGFYYSPKLVFFNHIWQVIICYDFEILQITFFILISFALKMGGKQKKLYQLFAGSVCDHGSNL